MKAGRHPFVVGVLCAGLVAIENPVGLAAEGVKSGEQALRFESRSHSAFSVQSQFTGTAVVTSNAIDVSIERVVFSFPNRGQAGDWRRITGYTVNLAAPDGDSWKEVSSSQLITVGSNLPFQGQLIIGSSRLKIPLVNILERTNHWLSFTVWHTSEQRPEPGFAEAHTARNLFTNLAPTGLTAPGMFGGLSGPTLAGFLRQHWTNFPAVKLLPPGPEGATVLQTFKATQNVIGVYAGRHYTGVRLTLPEWLDGDLEYAFVHAYRSQTELNQRPGYKWGLMDERGVSIAMSQVDRVAFRDYPETQARFPFTEKAYMGPASRSQLRPGRTYVFWWSHAWNRPDIDRPPPDLAVGFTVLSERGRNEFGEILWR